MKEHSPQVTANEQVMLKYAPEMYLALSGAVEALIATEAFMRWQGLETDNLNGIIRVIDELLDRIEQEG